jgi:imidazolonepropionase-like amidohydrolase
VNADLFGISTEAGRVQRGLAADLIAVDGDPSREISALRNPRFVMQAGKIVKFQEH